MHKVNNFQDFMVSLDRRDWQKNIQFQMKNYTSDPKHGSVNHTSFGNLDNMQNFVSATTDGFRNKNTERI